MDSFVEPFRKDADSYGGKRMQEDGSVQCCNCPLNCADALSFAYHWRTSHAVKLFGNECPVCRGRYYSVTQNRRHILVKHMGFRFECPFCQARFTSHEGFLAHIRTHQKQGVFIVRKKMAKKAVKRCNVCERKFKNENVLAKHQLRVRGLLNIV